MSEGVVGDRGGDGPDAVVAALRAAGCVFAEDEAVLLREAADGRADVLEQLLDERVAGRPLEHVLGFVEFAGLRVKVSAGVFVPRRRTQLLAEAASEVAARAAVVGRVPVVVDACCGCGAVALVVASRLRGRGLPVELVAVDVDPVATACAHLNLDAVGARVLTGDLLEPLPPELAGRVDVLVANAPYVPTAGLASMPPEARLHEPAGALDGGVDGLDVHRRLLAQARPWLAPGGHVAVETGRRQAPVMAALLEAAGFTSRIVSDEELDAWAVLGAVR